MEASVQYNDFKGTAAADISDYISTTFDGDYLESFASFFKINKEKFKITGISINGTENFHISLLCVDLEKSTEDKEHIVSMSIDWKSERNPLDVLFKRLEIVLHERFDEKYPSINYDEEIRFEDYHEVEDN
jgi:hypothetical protein